MPTQEVLTLMKARRNAAQSALSFFKEKKPIKSTNNVFDFTSTEDAETLYDYRMNHENTIIDTFNDAATTGIGNCDEKGRICYAALRSNPLMQPPMSNVTLCTAIDYDHVFVVVADMPLEEATSVKDLGKSAIIVDGWTEDWYFPNLDLLYTKKHGLGNTPNPRQALVRHNIAKHLFELYTVPVGL